MPVARPVPTRERLILALDVPDHARARALVDELGDAVAFYKVGFELLLAPGSFRDLLDWLAGRGKRVMVDLKLFDIENTVAAAVRQLRGAGASFVTVHGNDSILRAAAAEKGPGLAVLAVTVLTSLDRGDLDDLGFQVDVERLVRSRARRALAVGCDGVVASGLEAPGLRADLGERLLIVVPGVRPVENREEAPDDQKRIVDVAQALRGGADHVVVGRPIRNAPDPRAAAERMQAQIAAAVGA
jgi:orotidine-5'-phosphate decarboxylase